VVDVVAGLDDLAVTDPHHEHAGHGAGLAGRQHRGAVVELGHDDLGVGGLVDDDVVGPEPDGRGGVGTGGEVAPQVLTARERRHATGPHGVPDVSLLGVELGQRVEVAVGDAVDEAKEHLAGRG
jgi:hypothetical protein